MSDDFLDEMEALIGKHREKQAAEKQNAENEARFKRLEEGIGGIGALIDERIPSPSAAGNSEPSAEEKGEGKPSGRQAEPPPPDPEPEMNVERISKYTIPHVYQGDDEPEIVKYVDADTGETMTRKGRRRNYPTSMNVEMVMPEPENRPQEPSEEQTA